tara:strand:+ start:49 stop:1329 length:1281 start_codon:yes stop_codon:yes gene_type:complete
MEGQKSYIHVIPSNQPANAEIGHNNGNPMVNFNIGSQERFLIGESVRLTGTFKLYNSDGGDYADNGLATIDPVLGVANCLEQITISSKRTNQTIEQIKDYNRFLGSYYKAKEDEYELQTSEATTSLKAGSINAENKLQMENNGTELHFSISIPTGLLNSGSLIPLSDTWGTGGLLIQLNLAVDSNVIFAVDESVLAGTDRGYYLLKNVALEAVVHTPTGDDLARAQANTSMEYNSISSYYQVLNSSYATINFNLGLSRVISAFVSFVKSEYINSYSHGLATNGIQDGNDDNVNINNIQWLKNNMLFPNQYQIQDFVQNTAFFEPQLVRQYLNSIDEFSKIKSYEVYDGVNCQKNYSLSDYGDWVGNAFGIGIRYDALSDQGADFSSEQIGLIIQSDLQDNTPNSVYLFCNSRQIITFGAGGITVSK